MNENVLAFVDQIDWSLVLGTLQSMGFLGVAVAVGVAVLVAVFIVRHKEAALAAARKAASDEMIRKAFLDALAKQEWYEKNDRKAKTKRVGSRTPKAQAREKARQKRKRSKAARKVNRDA